MEDKGIPVLKSKVHGEGFFFFFIFCLQNEDKNVWMEASPLSMILLLFK